MILVNNTLETGNVALWLSGGSNAFKLGDSTTGATGTGTITYNSGITGYMWTNNYGSTANVSFGITKTRVIG
jgi:hypothetical protein